MDLNRIFNQVDWGVFPAHAEGWNLEILELMACGVPSIATNYSGHTEYLDKNNSLLIEPTGMEAARDGKWFHGQGEWCTYDIDSLVKQMRTAHKMKQEQQASYNKMVQFASESVEEFSWENSVKKLVKVL